jgi:predicted nuclease with RNAse H fold
MSLDQRDWDKPLSTAKAREKVRQLEADLLDQGIKLFPKTKAGVRAHALWRKIRLHLIRGGSVEITPSALSVSWHTQELKRARDVLVELELIRPRSDGHFVLERYDRLDELVRERFMDLKLLESVLVALSGVVQKSKTQKKS